MPPYIYCQSCGEFSHDDFVSLEALGCVPPPDILCFGDFLINKAYRRALLEHSPNYTVDEIVGTCLGLNDTFPSHTIWCRDRANGGEYDEGEGVNRDENIDDTCDTESDTIEESDWDTQSGEGDEGDEGDKWGEGGWSDVTED